MKENMEIEMEQKARYFFLFINSGSGGGLGKKLTSMEIDRIQFTLESNTNKNTFYCAKVFFVNMRIAKEKENGFRKLKQLINENQKTTAIVCGGDGTIMWVAQQFSKFSIDPMQVPIGIIPLGTGNDCSRYFGWGAEQTKFTEHTFKELKRLIGDWSNANEEMFDIWDVQAECFDYGYFQKVESGQNVKLADKKYKKTFCNYFSLGIDGKIGYSFDSHRTNSRIGNLLMYSVLGVVKSMTKTRQIGQLVAEMRKLKSQEEIQEEQSKIQNKTSLRMVANGSTNDINLHQEIPTETVFRSNLSLKSIKSSSGEDYQKSYLNLLALNIDSFMGGTNNIWRNSSQGINRQSIIYTEQSSSDGVLEFISFGSGISMAAQKVISGWGDKMTQGTGPYIIQFNQSKQIKKYRTYLQIDGQFIRFTNPKTVIIRKSKLFPSSKIKMLRNINR